MITRFSILKRGFSSSKAMSAAIHQVTVIGGGLMGSGIAQVAAQAGNTVTICEVNDDALQKAQSRIQTSLERVSKKMYKDKPEEGKKFISDTMGRVNLSKKVGESVKKADLVVEAIIEKMDVKHQLFKEIDAAAPPHTIFASNTSSLSIKEIASVTKRKDKFGGLHFFNPVPVMKLLEVIKTEETSEETYLQFLAWGKAIGKTTVTCKDTPGFVVNRLLVPYMAEACRLLERGDASARDIDTAMKLGAGYPMGPLELADYVGLDTTKYILDGWHKQFPENPLFAPIKIVDKLVAEGKFGVKAGEGFYSYKK
ncbi:probable 3-hydroxyacyl-CoA dehydrogenase B0272.3 isoform X1 [Hetaerina americana]